MKIHVIACRVMTREISRIAAGTDHTLQLYFLDQNFHDQPEVLRARLQKEIDQIEQAAANQESQPGRVYEGGEAIVLAYGLCSNSICGIKSSRFPIIAPRAHDCVALILGSRKRYQEYFDKYPGTYWYTPGWIEQTSMPGRERVEKLRSEYRDKYGEDNADYLMDMEQQWLHNYNRCAYVSWPDLDRDDYREVTKDSAGYLEWEFDQLVGSPELLTRILEGQWDAEDVLVVPPGKTIEPSYSPDVIQLTD